MAYHPLDVRLQERDRFGTILSRTAMVAVCVFMLIEACSAYRAWVQVYSVGLHVTTDTIAPGTTIEVDAVASGRTIVTVQLLLEQGPRSASLASMSLPHNGDPVTDPRPQRGRLVAGIRQAELAAFADGPARLKAIAVGRPQWMRTPPPTIVVRPVVLRRAGVTRPDRAGASCSSCAMSSGGPHRSAGRPW